jgi:hypothetical protein
MAFSLFLSTDRWLAIRYAASLEIARSTNRKNQTLRDPI